MKPPNGRKIVHRFNSELQPVGYEAGILSGILRLLGSDCTKFPICEKNWRKVRTKDKVYNECVKVKTYILEGLGRKRETSYTMTVMTQNGLLKKILNTGHQDHCGPLEMVPRLSQ
ncbi:hypothetical protein AHAS_Ahas09G0106400 [Arachis hypogaea]